MALHMHDVRLEPRAFLEFGRARGLPNGNGQEDDLGYGIHSWLTAAFGSDAPRPWRLLTGPYGLMRVLGYADRSAVVLRSRFREFADPSTAAVCPVPDAMITSKPMPAWRSGRRLGFEVQCCPVGRQAQTGAEKDLYLLRLDHQQEGAGLTREAVYCEWARDRLERTAACAVESIHVAGFRLTRQTRQAQGVPGGRVRSHPIRPQVLLRGELTVGEPQALDQLLAHGMGRHKAFGYGMVLLRPPT